MPENEQVQAVAREWMAKANNDLRSAAYLLKMKNCPTDTVCFHAQQCIEKSLKALLVMQGTDFRKTHDLKELVALLPSQFHNLLNSEEQDRLTEYATITRYPGNYDPISLAEGRRAVKTARLIYREIDRLMTERPPLR